MESGRSWHATALHLTTRTITTIAVMTYVHATIGAASSSSSSRESSSLPPTASTGNSGVPRGGVDVFDARRIDVEEALDIIEAASTDSMGEDCATMAGYKSLPAGAALDPRRYDVARQKTDMAAMMLQNLGATRHTFFWRIFVEARTAPEPLETLVDDIYNRRLSKLYAQEATQLGNKTEGVFCPPAMQVDGLSGKADPSYTVVLCSTYPVDKTYQDATYAVVYALLDAVAKSLLSSIGNAVGTRVVVFNASTETVIAATWLTRTPESMGEPTKIDSDALRPDTRPDPGLPWFENTGSSSNQLSRSPKFVQSAPIDSYMGWWTLPYLSCKNLQWLISYSVYVRPSDTRHGIREFLSVDIDISGLEVNQCDELPNAKIDSGTEDIGKLADNQIPSFRGSHKCHDDTTQCEYRGPNSRRLNENTLIGVAPGWTKGAYVCRCREGFYSLSSANSASGDEAPAFDGILVEAAWKEMQTNKSRRYDEMFRCLKCAPGCVRCKGPELCLATYNWPFRVTLLSVSVFCACGTVLLVAYVYQHRKLKVFKVASPIFLSITLLGCAIMYLEMAAIFPVLDLYSCVATKWTRHFGFCISYTALLMKTWRVSLTYRVKSAHKVKLTDKQLLQWMVPILLVMLIYLGTWTLSAPPHAKVIADSDGLEFYQCSYNWWDHSLAIGEILFLAWGIRVCYNVRNAESLFNEARLISYAIYNIAATNTTMIAIHLFIFPHAGPDMKYTLGFLRTQLSTSVTVLLVFGPKVLRVLRGHGDQWDSRARARGITASFSLNGIRGLVAEETTDLYQENEELKEEIQKLAAQIEFMKIVHMEMHNRHIKPKLGGYFSTPGSSWSSQSPNAKTSTASFILKSAVERGATAAAARAVEDSTFPSGSLHRARRMELLRERKAAREKEREKERAESQEQNAANTSKAAESSSPAAVSAAESAAEKV